MSSILSVWRWRSASMAAHSSGSTSEIDAHAADGTAATDTAGPPVGADLMAGIVPRVGEGVPGPVRRRGSGCAIGVARRWLAAAPKAERRLDAIGMPHTR